MGSKSLSPITISVVLYKNEPEHISQLCRSLKKTKSPLDVYFVDNSPNNDLAKYVIEPFHYYWSKKNIGFGQGHNRIISEHLNSGVYHLVINPDIYFDENTLEKITDYLDQREEIGLLLPRVLNPDNTEQPLYKLLPKPQDLFIRRFISNSIKKFFKEDLNQYQMSFADKKATFDAPYLSGCFMFIRKEALKEVGLFDPRFFLYCEDIDLSRRIRTKWRTTYYSHASVYHYFYKGSYKEFRLLYHHVISAIKYFNKYGWLIDRQRDQFNKETLDSFASLKQEPVMYVTK